MANYHTRFACVLPLGTAANVAQALDIYRGLTAEKDAEGEIIGFDATHQPLLSEAGLFLSADGDGNPEHAIGDDLYLIICEDHIASPPAHPLSPPASVGRSSGRKP